MVAPHRPPPVESVLGQVLRDAASRLRRAGVDAGRLEAEVLAAHLLERDRGRLLAGLREPAPPELASRLEPLLARRAAGEPLQHLTGVQEFWSMEFRVDPRVLIPRPETEGLVERALALIRRPDPFLVDVGTGSGCVAVALARELPGARILALDLCRDALRLARDNARRLTPAARIDWVQADLLQALRPRGRRPDVILSNPPYVAEPDLAGLPVHVRDHEPPRALVAGRTGLEALERLLGAAAPCLAPGGHLLLEIGAGQWEAVRGRARTAGCWGEPRVFEDFQGIPRVVAVPRGAIR